MKRTETVVIIHQPPRVWLAEKERGLGKKRYNGYGGGLEPGETLEWCAIRETFQEAGILIENPELMGKLKFQFEVGEQDHLVYCYRVRKFHGIPEKTEEMGTPTSFRETKLPYDQMWRADRLWLPLMLKDKKFEGFFLYDKNHQIVSYNLKEKLEVKIE